MLPNSSLERSDCDLSNELFGSIFTQVLWPRCENPDGNSGDSSGDNCHTAEDSPPRRCCCCLTAVGVVDVVAVTALVLSCRQLPDEWWWRWWLTHSHSHHCFHPPGPPRTRAPPHTRELSKLATLTRPETTPLSLSTALGLEWSPMGRRDARLCTHCHRQAGVKAAVGNKCFLEIKV